MKRGCDLLIWPLTARSKDRSLGSLVSSYTGFKRFRYSRFQAGPTGHREPSNSSILLQYPLAVDLVRHCIVIFLSYRIARVCA